MSKHLQSIEKRIKEVESAICAQMYVDDIAEALKMAQGRMRHEQHVQTLSDERAELAFLKLRKLQLEEAEKVAA